MRKTLLTTFFILYSFLFTFNVNTDTPINTTTEDTGYVQPISDILNDQKK